MPNPKPKPKHDPHTCSTSELQEFTDVAGGMPLEEALARPRYGKPENRQPSDATEQEPTRPGE